MGTPYWLDEPAPSFPSAAWSGRAEVAIVGGGVTGCSCALALARAGVRVRVHEARRIAEGASGRNGGFALRGGAMPYDRAREWVGGRRAQAYWRWTEAALDRLVEAGGDAVRRQGSLRLAADAEERVELRDEYDALRADGFAAEWLDADDLDAPLRGRFAAAIFHPPDAAIHPARIVRRIAYTAAEEGADIREGHRVEALDDVDAEQVVVATDGYPSGLLGDLEGLIVPTRGQMLGTEPLAERLFDLPHYGRHGYDYWHQTPDGAILAGGFRDASLADEFTAEEATTEAIQASLERFVTDLVGRPLRITRRWCGIFGLVPDLMPVVGALPGRDGVWVAGGYSGHGNVLGLACGEAVAAAITGRPGPMLELMRPERLLQPA